MWIISAYRRLIDIKIWSSIYFRPCLTLQSIINITSPTRWLPDVFVALLHWRLSFTPNCTHLDCHKLPEYLSMASTHLSREKLHRP
jgi:hypothetical protein